MNKPQSQSAQNSGQNPTLQNNAVPELGPDATPLEKKIVSHIKQCDKLKAEYQQAQGSCDISANIQAQTAQTNPKTIDDLRQAFANLAFSFDLVNADLADNKAIGVALVCLESDCEKLAAIAEAMRLQAKAERERNNAIVGGAA